jgi:hypothetical protein
MRKMECLKEEAMVHGAGHRVQGGTVFKKRGDPLISCPFAPQAGYGKFAGIGRMSQEQRQTLWIGELREC